MRIDFKSYNKYYGDVKVISYQDKLKDMEMTDWYDFKKCVYQTDLDRIKKLAQFIKQKCDILVVVGIGGSFLGTRAVIDCLRPYFNNGGVEMLYAGTDMSEEYMNELKEYIKDKNFFVNVVSKSGETIEIKYTLSGMLEVLKYRYGKSYNNYMAITTGSKGFLHDFALENGVSYFNVSKNIGGRYSVMSAVGLLPIMVMSDDADNLVEGYNVDNYDMAYEYAFYRHKFMNMGMNVEFITGYEKKMEYLLKWHQQLFAESLGKDGKGVLPVVNLNTTNLHSIGQYIQEGPMNYFETVIKIDGDSINNKVLEAVALAHENPTLIISIDKLDGYNLGCLLKFFMTASAIEGFMMGVNPFDQPGVERYKKILKDKLGSE